MKTTTTLLLITSLLLCTSLLTSAQAVNQTQGGRGRPQRPSGLPANASDVNRTQGSPQRHHNGNHTEGALNASQANGRPEGNATRNGGPDRMGERPGAARRGNRGNASEAVDANTEDAGAARLLASNDTDRQARAQRNSSEAANNTRDQRPRGGDRPSLVNGRFRPAGAQQQGRPAPSANSSEANFSRSVQGRGDNNSTRNGTDNDNDNDNERRRGPGGRGGDDRMNLSRADGNATRNATHEHRGPRRPINRRERDAANANTTVAAPEAEAEAVSSETNVSETSAEATTTSSTDDASAAVDASATVDEGAEAEEEENVEGERRMLRGTN